jgi:hypothetical protein
MPRKDHTLGRLVTGSLQLQDQAMVVVDETQLQPGQLNAHGVYVYHSTSLCHTLTHVCHTHLLPHPASPCSTLTHLDPPCPALTH